jgi:hypothetical protein
LARFPDGASIGDIKLSSSDISLRTLQRWLANLSGQGTIIVSGKARATIYKLAVGEATSERAVAEGEALIPLSAAGEHVRGLVTAPIQKRMPVGYNK